MKIINATKAKKYIHFANSLININKVFKVFILIKKSNEFKMFFEKSQTQTDQKSDINIIFIKLIRFFNLFIYFFSNIKFKKLFMRIVDYYDIIFKY